MNMQKLMQQAQQMQAQLIKEQKELDNTIYEGNSSFVNVKVNGKHEVVEVNLNLKLDELKELDDIGMFEDMIMLAFNDAQKKIVADKEQKMGKYGQGLAGLM